MHSTCHTFTDKFLSHLQQLAYEIASRDWKIRREREAPMQDPLVRLCCVILVKWRVPCNNLVYEDAKCPPVNSLPMALRK